MKVELFYNPYRVTSKVVVDGVEEKPSSLLNPPKGKRLQEWIYEFPKRLYEELREDDYDLIFHGTALDFEDVKWAIVKSNEENNFKINLSHVQIKEAKDVDAEIHKIFEDILNGPIEELKTEDIKEMYAKSASSECEIDIIATMSAGKSTLINALIGNKIMPSANQACTSTITYIKDNDSDVYEVSAFDSEGKLIEQVKNPDYDKMDELNGRQDVSKMIFEGDIPFVNSGNMKLVLVDTPGPNNARNMTHKKITYDMINESSKSLVIYLLNSNNLLTNDEDDLLKDVAASMEKRGKLSRDRFLFVINKLDEYDDEPENVPKVIAEVKQRLLELGIKEPNVYPMSAQAALDIRYGLMDENAEEKFKPRQIKKMEQRCELFDEEEFYFDNMASLTHRQKEILKEELDKGDFEKWLVHCGIRPLEVAIEDFVNKYAYTDKIKDTLAAFEHNVNSARYLEDIKSEIADNEATRQSINEEISKIQERKASEGVREKFEKDISAAMLDFEKQIEEGANKANSKAQASISKQIMIARGNGEKEISVKAAKKRVEEFEQQLNMIQAKFQSDLEKLFEKGSMEQVKTLFDNYVKRLNEYEFGFAGTGLSAYNIDPSKLIAGDINIERQKLIDELTFDKEYEVEVEKVDHSKKWYKFWTWFKPRTYTVTETRTKKMVKVEDLINKYFIEPEKSFIANAELIKKSAKDKNKEMEKAYKGIAKQLDEKLDAILEELKGLSEVAGQLEDDARKMNAKKQWLEGIQARIEKAIEV